MSLPDDSSDKIINPTSINIYGINSFINKFADSKIDILDLGLLKENFKLDYNYNESENEIIKKPLPAFTQLSFNERVTSGSITDESYSTSYNRPPLGPIENYCYCSYCKNIAPAYHTTECPFPEKKSLFLTIEGFYYYIVQSAKKDFSDKLNDLKESWLNNTLTQDELNSILLIPNSIRISPNQTSQSIKLDNTLTKIKYLDIIKSRGPSKLEYTTATEKFSNAIMLSYEYIKEDDEFSSESTTKKTSIRIYKNGLINLINVPSVESERKKLYDSIVKRINSSGNGTDDDGPDGPDGPEAVDIDNFNRVASEYTFDEFDEYAIIKNASYIHSVNSQFNLWKQKEKYSIDFRKLNDLISPFDSSGRIVSGEFTNVSNLGKTQKQIIELNYKGKSIYVINWEHSLGKDTRNQSTTREEIKCTVLPIDGIKISLQIHKHGTFQMSMSYCNATDLKNTICSTVLNKSETPLTFDYFETIKFIFTGIFTEKENLVGKSLDFTGETTESIRNTVSGKAPPNKPGTTTAVCRKTTSDYSKGKLGLRPIPYSFNGTCPESSQYINPIGVLGNDGLYYPCCSAKTKISEKEYNNYLINGFPKNAAESKEYGVNSIEDTKSGVLVPGSTLIGRITKAKIDNEWVPIKITGYKGSSQNPKEFKAQNLITKQNIMVKRENLERDSRYMPGLKKLNKEQLIKCIIKNLQYKDKIKNVIELENLAYIKNLINVPGTNYNPIMTVNNLEIFQEMKYYVTSVPNTTQMYYLYISPEKTYFINIQGNIKMKSLSENINEEIILLGFLDEQSDKYFVTDVLYFNKKITIPFLDKIEMLKEIQETYFLTEASIKFSDFEYNIIQGSKELLQESSDIFLIFVPETNYQAMKIWSDITINSEITLQIIKKNKTNYFTLGYENNTLRNTLISFDNIFIPKAFIENNQVTIGDYVLFKFDFNIQTNQLSSKIVLPIEKSIKPNLSVNETLTKISLITNPIKESFFMNNKLDQDYVWSIPKMDKILKFNEDSSPLELFN